MAQLTKQAALVVAIRQRIVAGQWAPGSRLPSYAELQRDFAVGRITVEYALRRLKRDGYVRAQRRVGLFVPEQPPHQACCALVFGIQREWGGESHWSLYYEALAQAAAALTHARERRIHLYFGLNTPHESDDYRRLLADVRACRVGGMIFAGSPHHLVGTPLLAEAGMPKVALYSSPVIAGIPAVTTDDQSFIDQALAWLASRGRRRIALLESSVYPGDGRRQDYFLAQLSRHGMTTHPVWVQCPSPYSPRAIHHATLAAVQAIPCAGHTQAADGVVILDDNLAEPAIAAMRTAGIKLGADVEVVTACNFPAAPACPPAVKLLGFDAATLLRTCIAALDRQRGHQAKRPPRTLIAVPATAALA